MAWPSPVRSGLGIGAWELPGGDAGHLKSVLSGPGPARKETLPAAPPAVHLESRVIRQGQNLPPPLLLHSAHLVPVRKPLTPEGVSFTLIRRRDGSRIGDRVFGRAYNRPDRSDVESAVEIGVQNSPTV